MTQIDKVLERVDSNLEQSTERLFELLRIKSISTDPAYKKDCVSAANWLVSELNSLNFDAGIRETQGHPMVVGHSKGTIDSGPHVLFYGHYDVQPVDPIELWENDPFDPTIQTRKDGSKIIVARGAADDKGQLMTFVEAARAWQEVTGGLPLKVTVLFEGEEESGSPSLLPFFAENSAELKCDLALVCDTGMWDEKTPAMTVMLRGLMGEEIEIIASNRDLHSGLYGGAARNPIHLLSEILSGLHDTQGRVTLPGFYDGVSEIPENVKVMWDNLGFSNEDFLGPIGLEEPAGEIDRSTLEQIWSRPTLEVNGIYGGYTGEGFKTVIPSKATAKISCRLVGDQDPEQIRESLRTFVSNKLPRDCSVKFEKHGSSPALWVDFQSPESKRTQQALSEEWECETKLVGMGGSIPIVNEFKYKLDMQTLLIGFGLDDDQIHSPNEKYNFTSFHKGIRSWVRILDKLANES